MKTTTWLVLILAAGLATGGFLTPTTYSAETAKLGSRPLLTSKFVDRAIERLDVSEEQTDQIMAALRENKASLTNLLSRLHDARADLRAAIHAPDASEDSVRAASAQVAVVEADLAVARLRLFGKLSPILTVEQRERLKTFQARLDELLDRAMHRVEERLVE